MPRDLKWGLSLGTWSAQLILGDYCEQNHYIFGMAAISTGDYVRLISLHFVCYRLLEPGTH